MKRMLATKFIDWIKKAFQSILIQTNGDDINVEIPGTLTADKNAQFPQGITTNGNSVLGDEQITYDIDGGIIDGIEGSVFVYSHGKSYSNVQGCLKNDSGTTITAGTTLSTLSNKYLHDAILNGIDIGFDHILGKIKGGPWAWLTMTADGSDNVLFSLNVDLPADALIYFTNCVDVGDYNLV
jgi:hypothetical protein